ncbi:MAG: plasmid pRiA4b ORF-3 family protein [Clostridiales bacterium]|nr:plasmid pRiA4b ORF-3 family protein [Clostridiales bacterium]
MATHPIYQFYAELNNYKPRMWRRFQVMNNITVARLGYIIMTMYEMQANHLFSFNVPAAENFRKCTGEYINNRVNGNVIDMFEKRPDLACLRIEFMSENVFSEFDGRTMDVTETKVKNILTEETEEMTFYYDFGDGWEIRLVLEKILEDKDLPGKDLPRVLEGEGYGIIEDCGGPGGLEEIARAFKKKKGPQYQHYSEWLEVDDLDLSSFDAADMNFRLKKVPRIYSDIYEYGLEPTKQSIDILMRNYMK